VLARNPEVIVDMGEMSQTEGVTEERKRAVVELWRRYPRLAAVKQNRVFAVAADIFVVPGPRVVDAARAFARMFHPGAAL
jgi:ABC-type Fe3+-hydroxamate transport system substrate-binding protein